MHCNAPVLCNVINMKSTTLMCWKNFNISAFILLNISVLYHITVDCMFYIKNLNPIDNMGICETIVGTESTIFEM